MTVLQFQLNSEQTYIYRSGCIQSSLVGYGVAEFEWIFSVAVEVTVVNVDRLNDGETISSRYTVASWWGAGCRTSLFSRLITHRSPAVVINL